MGPNEKQGPYEYDDVDPNLLKNCKFVDDRRPGNIISTYANSGVCQISQDTCYIVLANKEVRWTTDVPFTL